MVALSEPFAPLREITSPEVTLGRAGGACSITLFDAVGSFSLLDYDVCLILAMRSGCGASLSVLC
ncbi:MAG: hypothetical protein K2L17_12095, partial [Muribaculaceae bacterium]|nr:hypothetical protein [Muribaculaceae bacterium]